MKKVLVLVVLLAVAATSLSALDFVVGPKVGIADYSWRGDDAPSINGLSPSFEFGGFATIKINSMLGVQAEAMYTVSTIRFKTPSAPFDWIQFGINAISLPVYARFDFDLGGLGVYALAGAQFDLLVGEVRVKSSDSDWVDFGSVSSTFDNTFLISAALGAGVSLPAGPGVFEIGAGLKYGLTKLNENQDAWPWAVDVQLAYGFAL